MKNVALIFACFYCFTFSAQIDNCNRYFENNEFEYLLNQIWQGPVFQKVNQSEDERNMIKLDPPQYVYGEITRSGTDSLVMYLCKNNLIDKNWSFVDVGSGFGKMVMHIALLRGVKKSVGIEILESKNNRAKEAIKSIKGDFPKHKVNFFEGDILDVSELNFDIIYHNSVSWDKKYIEHIHKIAKEGSIFITTGNVKSRSGKYIIENIDKISVRCSWGNNVDGSPLYIYTIKK
tara:strand:+ start:102 stop:800 length:699 start_codon:yes stop_codon:yes gene_type:complete